MIAPRTRQHLREQIAAGAHVVSVAPGDLAEMLDATEPGVVRIAAADWRLVSLLGDGDHGISARLRPDETVAFSLKYCGAHTMRWAGDAGWNLQNMNKEPLLIDPEFSFIFDKVWTKQLCEEFSEFHAGVRATGGLQDGTVFFDFRGLIIARPGMKLAPVDLAQIEPRVLNYLAGNTALLEKIKQGMGIYEAFARQALGWTGGILKNEDPKVYSLSKADVLGLGFRAGWKNG